MFFSSAVRLIDRVFTSGKVVKVDRSKTPYTLEVTFGKRPKASGEIDESKYPIHTGFVNFPDDKKYQVNNQTMVKYSIHNRPGLQDRFS